MLSFSLMFVSSIELLSNGLFSEPSLALPSPYQRREDSRGREREGTATRRERERDFFSLLKHVGILELL